MRKSGSAVKTPVGITFQMPVTAVEASSNSKTGLCSATYASQATCPECCPLRGEGCYAESGCVGFITRRINRSATTDPETIARYEAAAIDCLSARLDLRIHVVGDCPTAESAYVVGQAAWRYLERARVCDRNVKVWTYSHAWRDVPRDVWSSVSVLASCETAADAEEAMSRGYAACILLERFEHTKSYPHAHGDFTVIPCPEQTRGMKCVDCRLCLNADRLLERRQVIGFVPRGRGARMALEVIENLS